MKSATEPAWDIGDLAWLVEYYGLSKEPSRSLQEAAAVLVPNASKIAERFYDRVLSLPFLRPFISNDITRQRLEAIQADYFKSLITSPLNHAYVEKRIAIGATHHRVGIDEIYVAGAYAVYMDILKPFLNELPPSIREDAMEEIFRRILFDLGLSMHNQFRETYSSLRDQALRDSLTGLYGRNYLTLVLDQTLQRTNGDVWSLIMLDVDHFKDINDRYGHLVGDAVLVHISRVLVSHARLEDVVIRYGGEEFCIVLPNTNLMNAVQVAKQIRGSVKRSTYENNGCRIPVTISAGVATALSGDEIHELICRADRALYQAKERGRDRVEISRAPKLERL